MNIFVQYYVVGCMFSQLLWLCYTICNQRHLQAALATHIIILGSVYQGLPVGYKNQVTLSVDQVSDTLFL